MPALTRRARPIAAALILAAAAALSVASVDAADASPAVSTNVGPLSPASVPDALGHRGASPSHRFTTSTDAVSAPSATPTLPLPDGGIAAAQLQTNAAPFGSEAQVEWHGDLYETAPVSSSYVSVLQKWNGYRFTRVAGSPSEYSYQPVLFNDEIYFLTYDPETNTDGLYSYDGTRFRTHLLLGSTAYLQPTGDCLDIFEFNGQDEQVACLGPDESYRSVTATPKRVTGVFTYKDSVYTFIRGTTSAAIYRIDGDALVKVATAPIGYQAAEWNGSMYFGGADYSSSTKTYRAGMYRFDGTTVEPVDVGPMFTSSAYDAPTVGVLGDDLYFTSDTKEKNTTLWRFDGSSSTKLGSMGAGYSYALVMFDGTVFADMQKTDGVTTWLYDPTAVAGSAVHGSVPVVSSSASVGKQVKAAPGDWTGTAVLSFAWQRDGVAIPGATKSYHTLTASDLGAKLTVEVTGTTPGYTPTTMASEPTATIAKGTIVLKPSIAGTPTAKHTLTATTPGLAPAAAKLTYRWYRDGKPLAGATKKTYTVKSGDAKHKLTVGVHASSPGYTSASATSAARTVAAAH